MTEMFGVSMQRIMVTLLVIMGLCLLAVAFIAWRQRVIFLMALRNLPRRKAQTVLIVFGLMLATLIIASALTIGDTLAFSIKKDVYDLAGPIDLAVVKGKEDRGRVVSREGSAAYFDRATYETVRARVAGSEHIDGLAPLLLSPVAILNEASKQSESVIFLLGIDAADVATLGGVAAGDGGASDLAALRDGEIILNRWLAEELNARVGDRVKLFARNEPHVFTVARIVRSSGPGGLGDLTSQGTIRGAVLLPAARAQAVVGEPGKYTTIVVSARGDAAGGLKHEAAAYAALKTAVNGTDLAVDPIKRRNLALAELIGNVFTSSFLVFGLFAIAAGVMLIFLIFVMLAAERRSELGMARAVGTQRRHLIQGFVAEGAAYDLLAAGVGAALGVGVAFGITGTMARLLQSQPITVAPHVEPRSLVIAYCLGVVVTFLTVVISSWRVSRLNIVAAIRDLEDSKKPGGSWRGLALGLLGIALGAVLWARAGTRIAPFSFGISLMILSSTLLLRRLRLPSRLIYSLAGGALTLFWALPQKTSDRLFGKHTGDIEILFVAGIMMVAGAVLLLVNNGELVVAGVNAFGGIVRRFIPALKMGTAYPLAQRFRTGLTLYMFALVIFVLVMMATMNANFDQLYNDPAKTTGGWDVSAQAPLDSPIEGNLRDVLAAGGVKTGDIVAIGGVARVLPDQAQVRTVGGTRPAGEFALNGVDEDWLAHTGYPLQTRAAGYADDAAVWRALRENPNLVVIPDFAIPRPGKDTGAAGEWRIEGLAPDATAFTPVQVELRSPATGSSRTVTVIGVTETAINDTAGLFVHRRTVDEVFGPQPVTHYFFKLRAGVDDRALARSIEAATLRHGLQAVSIRAQVAEANKLNAGFMALLQGFIGLGLVVGIAALGVVAFRAVVERRQQIGMLRAIGFGRGLVAAAFLIESLFITTGGILAGVTMAVILAQKLFTGGSVGDTTGVDFFVPWEQVALFVGIALAAALLMSVIPARQAGQVAPAEALRYE